MARYIPDDILEAIRHRADIVEVVQSYVPTLKKHGASWKACCPFHQEKTPSFIVNPERGTYKCFGCGKGGNVFMFVMEMERLDFPNAAEHLAHRYSIIIPDTPVKRKSYTNGAQPRSSSAPEASYNVRERLYQLHEKLASWYAGQLVQNPGSAVAQYFATRMIPNEIRDRFQLGASPDSWDSAIQFLRKSGFTEEELILSGVVSRKEENANHIYDRFRNRLMFPIWNEQGRVVAFSARSVEADPQGWKYVNSPENPVFRKSRTLYALHFARKGIADKKCAVLCEGQLDVIAMHRAGCDNAVAPQGTAFGEEQAAILHRYTETVCLALDNDKAGRAAVFKDAQILLPKGFQLKVAVFPGAKDADELLKKSGPEVLRNTVEQAGDFFDFALQVLAEETDRSTPAGKAYIASRIAAYLNLIENPMTLDLYAAWLGEQLAIGKEPVLAEITRQRNEQAAREARNARYAAMTPVAEVPEHIPQQPVEREIPFSERHPGVGKAYQELLELLLNSADHAGRAANDFESGMFDSSPCGRALEIVVQAQMNGEHEDAAGQIMMMLAQQDNVDPALTAILSGNGEARNRKADERIYQGCLAAIGKTYLQDRRAQLIRKASQLPDGSEEKRRYLQEVTELTRQIFARKT